jgi:CBS domain-containing protein
MKTGVKVMDAMTHAPVVARPSATLQECAKLMIKRKLGNVLIIRKEKLKGIVTERDLIRATIAKRFDPKKTQVEEIMTKKVKTISPNKDIVEAMQHMQASKIRRLPVVFKGNVIGIITDKDIIKLQPAILELIAERGKIKKSRKERYIEGICDSCESYAQLHEKDGNFICEECLDQL